MIPFPNPHRSTPEIRNYCPHKSVTTHNNSLLCLSCGGPVNLEDKMGLCQHNSYDEKRKCIICGHVLDELTIHEEKERKEKLTKSCIHPQTERDRHGILSCSVCGEVLEGTPNITLRKEDEGLRYNTGKIPYQYIPLTLLTDCAKVFEQVTQRKDNPYPIWNWLKDKPVSYAYASLMRHMSAWYEGQDLDSETGLPHLAHAMCNLLMLTRHIQNPKNDDRPKEFFTNVKP